MKVRAIFLFLTTFIIATHCQNEEKEWWRTATFYQIYPRSFMDTTGNGIGDLKGMIERLDHLKDAGFDTFWLSPIFKSPQVDTGYDVSDYYTIEPDYGTMDDFKALIDKAKSLGIRVMLDFIPNHSSDQHEWFIKSAANDPDYRDYYVWRDGKLDSENNTVEPNNWISVFGGPAWTWNDQRQQYYLHQFSSAQPDLNYNNQNLTDEMSKMLLFYIDMGVAGFRLDAINHLFEDPEFKDEPWAGETEPKYYDDLNHIYTKDLNETFLFVYKWRKMIDDYIAEKGLTSDILIMTEAYASTSDTMRYYRDPTNPDIRGAHMPFNFQLIFNFGRDSKSSDVSNGIFEWLNNMPEGETANWVAGSHDHSRVASRVMPEKIHMVNTVVMTLPGSSITYYGEEIGMHDNNDVPNWDGRNKNRTPMQWSGGEYAGFKKFIGENDTWLPIHPNYITVNLQAERERQRSTYKYFQSLSALRKTNALRKGDFKFEIVNEDVFAYSRNYDEDEEGYLIVINTSGSEQQVDLSNFTIYDKEKLRVVTSAPNSRFDVGDVAERNNVILGLYDAVVFDYVSTASSAVVSLVILILSSLTFLFL